MLKGLETGRLNLGDLSILQPVVEGDYYFNPAQRITENDWQGMRIVFGGAVQTFCSGETVIPERSRY